MWTAIAVLYGIGMIGTFLYNGAIIYGPINYVTVSRNALLWPVFLPMLINANRGS